MAEFCKDDAGASVVLPVSGVMLDGTSTSTFAPVFMSLFSGIAGDGGGGVGAGVDTVVLIAVLEKEKLNANEDDHKKA